MNHTSRGAVSMAATAKLFFVCGMLLLGFSTSPAQGFVVIAFGLPPLAVTAALYVALRLRDPMIDRIVVPFALAGISLVTGLALATLVSPTPVESFARFIPNLLGFFLFGYVLSPFYRASGSALERHEELAALLVVTGTLIGGYFLVRFVLAVSTIGFAAVIVDRVTGGVYSLPWGATNVVGSVLILPIFLSFYLSRIVGPSVRPILLAARLVMLAAVAVALSRAVNISIATGMLLLLFVLRGRPRRQLLVFAGLAALALAFADHVTGGVLSEQLLGAFVDRFQSSDTASLNGRSDIWVTFLGAFQESPLLGIGYYASLPTFDSSGHNFLLTSLIERGIVGFALSAVVLIASFRYWFRALQRARSLELRFFLTTLGVGGFSSLFHLMFEDANFTQPYMIMSWVALSLPFLAWRSTLGDLVRPVPLRDPFSRE